jgi:hypothetical protein
MTIRGGGNPHLAMAAMPLREWTRRLGALPAGAYDCFMVGTPYGFNRIQAWFARLIAANGRLPSDHPRPTTRMPPAPVRQGQVFGSAEDAPSLTAAAHDDDGKSGRGGRMLAAPVEQKNGMTKDDKNGVMPLTKKAPYKPDGQPTESFDQNDPYRLILDGTVHVSGPGDALMSPWRKKPAGRRRNQHAIAARRNQRVLRLVRQQRIQRGGDRCDGA